MGRYLICLDCTLISFFRTSSISISFKIDPVDKTDRLNGYEIDPALFVVGTTDKYVGKHLKTVTIERYTFDTKMRNDEMYVMPKGTLL